MEIILVISEILKAHIQYSPMGENQQCAICGIISPCISIKDTISGNFNDYQYLKYNTGYICNVCHACLKEDGFNSKSLRYYHIIANPGEIHILKKSDIIKYILSPIEPPFVFLVSFTKKKHIFLHAKINYSNDPLYIATDKHDIIVKIAEFKQLYSACNTLYQMGFSKGEIDSGRYKNLSLIDSTPGFYIHENVIYKFRNQFLLQFITFILVKEDINDKD